MKKLMTFIRKNKGYFLAFLIPFLSLLILFVLLRVLYFNKYTILISDMKAQYISLFHYLKEILQGKHSIFYSFKNGLGGNMFGIFCYYLISPINLIVLLFSDARFHYALLLISFIKISLSGMTMFYYLKKHYPKQKEIYLLLFTTSYALMTYNICYYFNILWLDSLYLLPLMCYGIDQIIEKKKSLLYGISLFLAILCNYYIGYMMCIFSVLYYLHSLFNHYSFQKDKKEMLERTILYGGTSLFAGLTATFTFLPSFLNIINSSKSISETYQLGIEFTSIYELFSRGYIGSQSSSNILCHGGPMIYVGMIMLVLIFLYFLNKKISKKEKVLSFSILFIFLISFDVNYLNYIWHGFNVPVGFDHRFAFLFNFFFLILCTKAFFLKEGNTKLHYFLVAPILPLFSIGMTLQNFEYLSLECIYISVIFYLLYLFFLYAFHLIKEKRQETLLSSLLLCLVISELFFNSYWCLKDYVFDIRKENYDYMTQIKEELSKLTTKSEKEFYRIEKDFSYTKLDSFLYEYNGISSFLSTIPESEITFWHNVGYNDYINSFSYIPGYPPILESILGMKYLIFSSHDFQYGNEIKRFPFSKYFGEFHGMFNTDYIIYENPYALNIGYMISDECKKYDDLEKILFPTLSIQNYIWSSMLNSNENVLTAELTTQIGKNTYQFVVNSENDIYFDFLKSEGELYQTTQIYFNDQLFYQFNDNTFTAYRIKKGTFELGQTVTIRIEYSEDDIETSNLILYHFNEEIFQKQYEQLKEHELQIDTIRDGYLKGTIEATEEMPILFLSIPNEDGWILKVDGKKTEISTIYDTFMGIKLTPGEHEIELEYHVPGLKLSLIISFISLILWILFTLKKEKICKWCTNLYFEHEEIWNYLIVGICTTIVNVICYAVFSKLFHVYYMISTMIAWILSVLFAYITNKKFVFKTKTKNYKELIQECYQFFKYRIFSLGIEMVCMYVFVTILKSQDIISKIVVNIIVIVSNYFFSKLFVFKK